MKYVVMFLLASLAACAIYITWMQHRLDVALRMLERTRRKPQQAARLNRAIKSASSSPILPASDLLDAIVVEPERVLFVVAKNGDSQDRDRQAKLKKLVNEGSVVWIDEEH